MQPLWMHICCCSRHGSAQMQPSLNILSQSRQLHLALNAIPWYHWAQEVIDSLQVLLSIVSQRFTIPHLALREAIGMEHRFLLDHLQASALHQTRPATVLFCILLALVTPVHGSGSQEVARMGEIVSTVMPVQMENLKTVRQESRPRCAWGSCHQNRMAPLSKTPDLP